ncbi:hypothetical protein RB6838 [Rhodopirellula baltica SH 1]|uniref:Uncharacterized protein n=1 Tax=Rhodopirellula baltica (strain DSM 10527 / NCIMB 13988 / SH1) TaxID=243090 RepID=Q7UPM7_RHOBA|nr:hypothetical protein RB6838 [Rhodopirellula baltica SH 1]
MKRIVGATTDPSWECARGASNQGTLDSVISVAILVPGINPSESVETSQAQFREHV